MPKSRFDEIALRTSPCRICFRRSRQLEQLRPDFRSDPEGCCDSNCCESNRPTSGADQKDRRAKCEDRHAFAANPEAPVTAVQSTPWGHDWRRRALANHDPPRCAEHSSAGRCHTNTVRTFPTVEKETKRLCLSVQCWLPQPRFTLTPSSSAILIS